MSDFVLHGDEEVKEALNTRPKVSEFVLQGDEEEAVCTVLTTLSMLRRLGRMPAESNYRWPVVVVVVVVAAFF